MAAHEGAEKKAARKPVKKKAGQAAGASSWRQGQLEAAVW